MLFKQQNAHRDQSMSTASDGAPPIRPTLSPSAPAPVAPSAPAIDAADEHTETGKRLIVGEGIQLKGEITACDRLVVEGEVEVTLNDTRALEIKPSGRFTGSCEVDEAEICGVYDGDLTVRGRLTVQTGGRVAGKICYGEIELQRGGQVAGELSLRDQESSRRSVQRKGGPKRDAA
jgi:cytoskeletal protein CcmA (bactofilin family)